MALKPPPAFVGKITISGTNNKIYWQEYPSTTLYNATLSANDYYPQDIATEIQTAMNGAGGAHTYTVTWDILTGKFTISATGDFKIKSLSTDTNKAWTGGDSDTNGDTLNDAQLIAHHLGFPQDDAGTVYVQASSVVAPEACFAYWRPTYPPTGDNEERYESLFSEAIAIGGGSTIYDYTGAVTDADFYPKNAQLQEYRDIAFQMILQASRDQFLANFWLHYAKQGKSFRYYSNPSGADPVRVYRLTGNSLGISTFLERRSNLPMWSGSLEMKRLPDDVVNIFTSIIAALDTESVDLDYTQSTYYRTMTEPTTLTFTGQKTGNTSELLIDSISSGKKLSLPSGVSILSGSFDDSKGRVNKYALTCVNGALNTHQANITTQAVDTNIHAVWPMNELGGNFTLGEGNQLTKDAPSIVFPSGLFWGTRGGGGIGGSYLIDNNGTAIAYKTTLQEKITSDFVLSVIVRVDSAPSSKAVISLTNDGVNDALSLFVSPTNSKYYLQTLVSAASQDLNAANNSWVAATEQHIIIQQSGTTAALWVNGVKVSATHTAQDLTVLRDMYFLGTVSTATDGALIYAESASVALTDAEASSVYNGSVANVQSLEAVLDSSRGANTYKNIAFARKWGFEEYTQANNNDLDSQELDHTSSIVSSSMGTGLNRIPTPSTAQKVAGLTTYDFTGVVGGGVELETNTLSGDLTFVFWLQYHVLTSGYFLYSRPNPYINFNNAFAMFASGSGNIVFSHTDASNVTRNITTASTFGINTDYCIIFDVSASGDATISVNNSIDNASGNIAALSAVLREYVLGMNPSGGVSPFNGYMYRHEVYKGILTSQQKQFVFNNGRGNSIANVLAS